MYMLACSWNETTCEGFDIVNSKPSSNLCSTTTRSNIIIKGHIPVYKTPHVD